MNTKYTKKQRLAIAAVFRQAKNFLWDGKYLSRKPDNKKHYICFAINAAVPWDHRNACEPSDRTWAKDVVNARLGNFAMVEGYLRQTLGIPKKLLTKRNVQTFRHLWLDSLIEEFSK